MFTLRSPQARLSVRMVLTGMLLLLSLVGPAPGLAYSAPALSGDLDGGGGSAFADLPSEPAKLEEVAPSPGPGTAHGPTIEMGIANTGLATTLDVLQDLITPTLQFSSSTYTVGEGVGSAVITVTLVPTSTDPVTVTYAIVPGTATPVDDYTGTGGTLSFAPDDGTETISVPIADDLLDELEETFSVALSNPISAELGTPYTATLTILDNDPQPTVQFQSASYGVNEVTSPVTVTVGLSAESGLTVTVDYAMSSGTATADEDFVDEAGTLTFSPGQTTQDLGVRIVDDVLDEDNEAFSVALGSPSHAALGAIDETTVTITDDDNPPTIEFDSASYSVDEGAGQATITVTLSAPSSREISVHYATSDGTATAGSDYTAQDDELTFGPADVTVDAVLEQVFETSDSFWDPSSPDPAGVAYISHLNRLMISDCDVDEMSFYEDANVYVATLSGVLSDTFTTASFQPISSTEPTGVAYNPVNHHVFFSDDNRGRIFEVDPGTDGLYATGDDTVTSFRVTHFDSADAEGVTYDTKEGHLFMSDGVQEEIYDISPGLNGVFDDIAGYCTGCDDAATHFDTDRLGVHNPEGVEYDPFTDHLYVLGEGDDPIGETTRDGKLIRFIDITSLYANNPGSLAYAPSSTDPSEWDLYVLERGVDNGEDPNENDGKAYEISFPPGETTLTFTVPITDDMLAEGTETVNLTLSAPSYATLGQSSATLTIVDGLSGVQFSDATYDVNEGAGSATITATLDTPSALVVTVDYTASGGTATADSDYVAASGTLTFPVGVTARTFYVTVVDDNVDEVVQETVNLTLSNPGNAELGTPTSAVLHIQDNDPPPTVQFSPAVFAQNEHGASAVIGVALSAPSAFLITVDYATSDGTATAGNDYLAASGTLTFTPGTTTQSFSVSILNDTLDELNETVNLSLSNPSNASVGTPTSTLTIVDDDGASTVQFSDSSYSIGEGGGTATITVTLSPQSGQPVTVQYATGNGTATAGSDYTGTSGTLTFAPGETVQTFSVAVTEDSVDEADETVNLTLSNVTNATLDTPSTATLSIVDNDEQPNVQFSASSYSVNETAGSVTITVVLSAVSGKTITVNYATSDGTAVAGSDYVAKTGTLTFAPGVTEQTFTVTIVNDTLNEDDETVVLTLSNLINVSPGTHSSATLTIVQDVLRVYLPVIFRNH